MAIIDPIGDMLIRITNGLHARQSAVVAPHSQFRLRVLDVFKREGYIRGYEKVEADGGKQQLRIELKYHEGEPAIRFLRRVSKPGRRIYTSVQDLKPVRNGLGTVILSTPQGVLSDNEARAANVGGEVICHIF